jgi:hypothetical protein
MLKTFLLTIKTFTIMAKTTSVRQYSRTINNDATAFDEWSEGTKIFFLHPEDIGCETTLASRNNETGKSYFNGHLVLTKYGDTIVLRSLTAMLLNGYFSIFDEDRPQRNHDATKALGALQQSVFMPANKNRVACIVDNIYEGRGKWSRKSDETTIIALGLSYIDETYKVDNDNIVIDGAEYPIADIQRYVKEINAKAEDDAKAWNAQNEE